MDKEHAKGAMDKGKGSIKDVVGNVTGNNKMKAEGQFDSAKGRVENALGDAKDAAKKLGDKAKDALGKAEQAVTNKVNQLKK